MAKQGFLLKLAPTRKWGLEKVLEADLKIDGAKNLYQVENFRKSRVDG